MTDFLVYFANNLPKKEELDRQRRKEVLDQGLRAFQRIPDLSVLTTLELTAFAHVRILSDAAMTQFREVCNTLDPKPAFVEDTGQQVFRGAFENPGAIDM